MTNLFIIAACLILEAGGEPPPGMESVMEVIQTRANQRGITLERVCLQPKQFSCFNGVAVSAAIEKAKQHPKWEKAVAIACGTKTAHTRGSNHYCTTSITPYWAKGKMPVVIIGNHKFYRL